MGEGGRGDARLDAETPGVGCGGEGKMGGFQERKAQGHVSRHYCARHYHAEHGKRTRETSCLFLDFLGVILFPMLLGLNRLSSLRIVAYYTCFFFFILGCGLCWCNLIPVCCLTSFFFLAFKRFSFFRFCNRKGITDGVYSTYILSFVWILGCNTDGYRFTGTTADTCGGYIAMRGKFCAETAIRRRG